MGEHYWSEKALFTKAISLPVDEQQGFVENSAAPIKIRNSVLELLNTKQSVPSAFLEPPDSPIDARGFNRIGQYKIVRRIASGGMGVVYEGWDEKRGRRVALKVLALHLSESDDARDRLRHEAYVVAKLSDPGIVQVYGIVEFEKTIAIVSEYVDGGTVEDLIAQHRGSSGLVSGSESVINQRPVVKKQWIAVDRVLQLVGGVASALVHAHTAGVIHRDIKPSNILIDNSTGNSHLTDFGIAKLLTQTEVLHTSAGAGTCHYMSPEQVCDDSSCVGPASDVFSLGIVLYELITLEHAFSGSTREMVIHAIQSGDIKLPREIRKEIQIDLETVCLKALEIDVRYRYKTMIEFLQDLECVVGGLPISAKRPSTTRRVMKVTKARRYPLLIGGALLVGIGGGLAIMQRVLDDRAELHVLLEVPNAKVSVQQLDEETLRYDSVVHKFRESKKIRLERGLYRISMRSEGGLREFVRMLESGQSEKLVFSRPATELNRNEMVLIDPPTSEQLLKAPDDFVKLMSGMTSFLIDKFEVSNAQYLAFVIATGHKKPSYWPDPYDKNWDDLPVTSVSYWDAEAYAEWAGKRLPTYQEWQLAARGPQGEPFPWGNHGVPSEGAINLGNFGAVDSGVMNAFGDYLFHFESYSNGVCPVNSGEFADQRNGVLHMFGNVSEWTNSPSVGYPFGSSEVDFDKRVICGQAWAEPNQSPAPFLVSDVTNDETTGLVISRGFRCAVSAE